MFPSSVIRKLALSEEMLAETHNFVGLSAHLEGPIDVDALTDAFDLLLEAHPVLTARLERGADGRHDLVADDLMHAGLEVVEVDASQTDNPPPHFDQGEALVHLRLFIRDGQAHPTLYVHHALADGHHMYGLIEELLSFYTDLVTNGKTAPVTAQPAPESIETVLADRGIQKGPRSGIERFMPALFAYDLPPSRRGDTGPAPSSPVRVPMVSCRLSESQTHSIVELCRAEKLGLHSVLSAAILIAEWQVRGRLNIPVPFIYTVDLRYFLSPPVSATGCTNPVGLGTYLAEISPKTTVVGLARNIAATFKGDLDGGVIQQSRLHFSPQYVGNAPGMPDVVLLSDNGLVPPVRTPAGVDVTATHGELYFQVSAGIEIYFTQIYAEQLNVEYHSHGPEPEKSIEAIHALLVAVAEQHASVS